ncbi:hypothetical protein ACWDKQ_04040 [Saccharopolyspora sp. NPDC000995]
MRRLGQAEVLIFSRRAIGSGSAASAPAAVPSCHGHGQPRFLEATAAVASRVASCVSEVSRDVYTHLISEAPQLRADEIALSILRTSVEENFARLPHILEYEIPLENSPGPAAVLEYSRRLAQRNLSINVLIRANRIGHFRFLS